MGDNQMLLVECEGSGYPTHDDGMCTMCGGYPGLVNGEAVHHNRPDILRMLERGDYG